MVRFLVVLDPSCSEERASVIRVISEFSLSRRLEVCVIATQLVMGIDLIEGVLVAEELILGEADIFSSGPNDDAPTYSSLSYPLRTYSSALNHAAGIARGNSCRSRLSARRP